MVKLISRCHLDIHLMNVSEFPQYLRWNVDLAGNRQGEERGRVISNIDKRNKSTDFVVNWCDGTKIISRINKLIFKSI